MTTCTRESQNAVTPTVDDDTDDVKAHSVVTQVNAGTLDYEATYLIYSWPPLACCECARDSTHSASRAHASTENLGSRRVAHTHKLCWSRYALRTSTSSSPNKGTHRVSTYTGATLRNHTSSCTPSFSPYPAPHPPPLYPRPTRTFPSCGGGYHALLLNRSLPKGRKLKLKAKFESGSSYCNIKR